MKIFTVFCAIILSLVLSTVFIFLSGVWVPHGNGGVSRGVAYSMLALAVLSPIAAIVWSVFRLSKDN